MCHVWITYCLLRVDRLGFCNFLAKCASAGCRYNPALRVTAERALRSSYLHTGLLASLQNLASLVDMAVLAEAALTPGSA